MSIALRIRRLVTHNWPLKLLSLIISIVLYRGIAHQPIDEVGVIVPLQYRNVPPGEKVASEQPPQLQVRLRGPDDRVRRLSSADISAALDLAHVPPGRHSFDLNRDVVQTPYGLDLVDVIPNRFTLTITPASVSQVPPAPPVQP